MASHLASNQEQQAMKTSIAGRTPCDFLGLLLRSASENAIHDTRNHSWSVVQGGLSASQFDRVLILTSTHLGRPLTVSFLAQACDLSIGHFTRSFKNTTGQAPHQWLTHIRVAVALDLGRRTGMTIEDIVQACGFVDTSHLNKWTRRCTGHSLAGWKRVQGTSRRTSQVL